MRFYPGDSVHVAALGKGVVRQVRNGGRYLVELKGRAVVVFEAQLSAVESPKRPRTAASPTVHAMPPSPAPMPSPTSSSIDLHGLTAAEATSAVDAFLNAALLASLEEVRIVHGRSGGRLKAAVHARLRELPSVRRFRLDPRNAGVTIVTL